MPRVTPLLMLLGLAVVTPVAAAPDSDVWRMVSTYLIKEAEIALDDLPAPADPANAREREFCTAVVALSQQTVTEARIAEVERRLTALHDAQADDEIGRASLFLLGRIAQVFRAVPDNDRAADCYRRLLTGEVTDHWADLARVKLALLDIYVLPAAAPAARIAAVESLLTGVTDPVTRRDLHRLAARGLMFYGLDPARTLEHLLASESIGGLRGMPAADQVVQICNVAWQLGRHEVSDTFREKLRRDYPRDPRIYLLDQRAAGQPVPVGTKKGGA
jgi:hypothetical protein